MLIRTLIFSAFALSASACSSTFWEMDTTSFELVRPSESYRYNMPRSGAVKIEEPALADCSGLTVGKTLDGDAIILGQGDLKGKVIVLNFFKPRCPACIAEFPHLGTAQRELAKEDVVVIAVSIIPGEEDEVIRNLVRDSAAEGVIVGHADMDNWRKLEEIDEDYGTPFTVFIDAECKARKTHRGKASKEELMAGARAMK